MGWYKKYEYSHRWFVGSEIRKALGKTIPRRSANRILEIGSFEGLSACYFSDYFMGNDRSRLTCVDPYLSSDTTTPCVTRETKERFLRNISRSKNSSKIIFKCMTSDDFFKENTVSYSFIYIDGCHEPEFIERDLLNSMSCIEYGGVIWLDDYGCNNTVRKTMDRIVSQNTDEFKVIHRGYQLAIKRSDPNGSPMDVVLSYPRSGNHLVRFFIELLTGCPTAGCIGNKEDIPIHQNFINDNNTPFNGLLSVDDTRPYSFVKCHNIQGISGSAAIYGQLRKLIFIVRSPFEVIIRHGDMDMVDIYVELIEFYSSYKGPKLLLYYEDIITDVPGFVRELAKFIPCDDERSTYIEANADELFNFSYRAKYNVASIGMSNLKTSCYYEGAYPALRTRIDDFIEKNLTNHRFSFIMDRYLKDNNDPVN